MALMGYSSALTTSMIDDGKPNPSIALSVVLSRAIIEFLPNVPKKDIDPLIRNLKKFKFRKYITKQLKEATKENKKK